MKKRKKILKIFAISVVLLTTISVIPAILMLFQFDDIMKEANKEYYDIEGVKIPSIVKVLGEERKVNKLKIGKINKDPAKVFIYFSDGKLEADLKKYIDYLINEEKYNKAFDFEVDTQLRTAYLIKYDETLQKNIEIKVQGNLDRYTIGIKILGDGEKIDVKENWDKKFEGDTLEKN